MEERISKITRIILIVLLVLGLIFTVWFYYTNMRMGAIPENIVLPSAKVQWQMEQLGASLSSIAYYTYVLMALSILITLGFSIWGMIKKPQTAKRSLMSLGLLIVMFFISYLFASPDIPQDYIEKFSLTPGIVKMVDVGIIASYILLGLAILTVIGAGIRNALIKR